MNNIKKILLITMLLSIVCIMYAADEEQPFETEWSMFGNSKIYIPPGSAVKYLGELFVQLNINGGVHIGPSFGNSILKWREEDHNAYLGERGCRPGDPDYCAEFLCKADSVKGVLDRYCKGKKIFWEVKDNTVNMFTGDARPGKENLLDIPLDTVKIVQGDHMRLLFVNLISALKKKIAGKKENISYIKNYLDGTGDMAIVLPDYREVMTYSFRMPRTYIFKDKTARYILNTIFKPHPNIIWIFFETDNYSFFGIGSWHEKLQHISVGMENYRKLLVDYMQKEILVECKRILCRHKDSDIKDINAEALMPTLYSLSFIEALKKLYGDYKKDPERVMKALDDEIAKPNGDWQKPFPKTEAEIRMWKDIKKYIQKPFKEFKIILF